MLWICDLDTAGLCNSSGRTKSLKLSKVAVVLCLLQMASVHYCCNCFCLLSPGTGTCNEVLFSDSCCKLGYCPECITMLNSSSHAIVVCKPTGRADLLFYFFRNYHKCLRHLSSHIDMTSCLWTMLTCNLSETSTLTKLQLPVVHSTLIQHDSNSLLANFAKWFLIGKFACTDCICKSATPFANGVPLWHKSTIHCQFDKM